MASVIRAINRLVLHGLSREIREKRRNDAKILSKNKRLIYLVVDGIDVSSGWHRCFSVDDKIYLE